MLVATFAFVIGVVAGLRAFGSPSAVSWAVRLGWLPLLGTGLGLLVSPWSVALLVLAAVGEMVYARLVAATATMKRPVLQPMLARVCSGALCGAAVGVGSGSPLLGMFTGALGALFGALPETRVFGRLRRTVCRQDDLVVSAA